MFPSCFTHITVLCIAIDASAVCAADVLSTSKVTPRIVQGIWAKKGAFPFQAAIVFENLENGQVQFGCGGTLIDKYHVLTAAHCIYKDIMGSTKQPVAVILRNTNLGTPHDNGTVIAEVGGYLTHEKFFYNESSSLSITFNDIGLLRLKEPVTNVRPVRLPSSKFEKKHIGKFGTITGWGRTNIAIFPKESSGPTSNKLRQVSARVIPNWACQVMYTGIYNLTINEDQFCAAAEHGKGACQGDSGGPLLMGRPMVQIGITSMSGGCGDPRFPDVYTRVASYIDWIRMNTRNNGNNSS